MCLCLGACVRAHERNKESDKMKYWEPLSAAFRSTKCQKDQISIKYILHCTLYKNTAYKNIILNDLLDSIFDPWVVGFFLFRKTNKWQIYTYVGVFTLEIVGLSKKKMAQQNKHCIQMVIFHKQRKYKYHRHALPKSTWSAGTSHALLHSWSGRIWHIWSHNVPHTTVASP